MCGIFGVIQQDSDKKEMSKLCRFMQDATRVGILRGYDSTGFLQVRAKDNVNIHKLPISGEFMSDNKRAISMFNMADTHPITIGHHRAATRGEISQANCHPFEHWDSTNYLAGVHNGYFLPWSTKQDGIEFEVDSDWGLYKIFKEGDLKGLSLLEGAYALMWYRNDGKVRMAANALRELHFAFIAKKNAMIFASEHGMLWWLAQRHGIQIEDTIHFPTPGNLYTFDPRDVRAYTKEAFEEPKLDTLWNSGHGWHGNNNRRPTTTPQLPAPSNSATTVAGEIISYSGDEVATRLGVTLGDVCEFYLDRKKYSQLSATNMDMKELFGEILVGEDEFPAIMTGVTPVVRGSVIIADVAKNCVECRIVGVAKTKGIDGLLHETAILSQPVRIVSQLAEQEDDDTPVDNGDLEKGLLIPGPGGAKISVVDFNYLTREGCQGCGGNLTVQEGLTGEVVWQGGDVGKVAPMCTTCAKHFGGSEIRACN